MSVTVHARLLRQSLRPVPLWGGLLQESVVAGELLYFLHKHFRMTVVLTLCVTAVLIAGSAILGLLRPVTGA